MLLLLNMVALSTVLERNSGIRRPSSARTKYSESSLSVLITKTSLKTSLSLVTHFENCYLSVP